MWLYRFAIVCSHDARFSTMVSSVHEPVGGGSAATPSGSQTECTDIDLKDQIKIHTMYV